MADSVPQTFSRHTFQTNVLLRTDPYCCTAHKSFLHILFYPQAVLHNAAIRLHRKYPHVFWFCKPFRQ